MALVRSIVFDKPDGGKRPVAIGEGLYRFIWKCVMKVVGQQLGRKLMPLQLAVGVPGGCEIGARMAQLAYDVGGEGILGGGGENVPCPD
jgi:hypothetical protein